MAILVIGEIGRKVQSVLLLAKMKTCSAYDTLFHAGYARAKADWLVGMNSFR